MVDLGGGPEAWTIEPARISLLALTHLHADHAPIAVIEAMLEQTCCRVLVSAAAWEHDVNDEARQVKDLLEKSGRLELLDSAGQSKVGNWSVAWVPLSHAVNGKVVLGGNQAFRINGSIISGDGPIRELFTESNLGFLAPSAGRPVTTLVLNIAHAGIEDLQSQDHLPEERKKRYREEHGLLEDLVRALEDPIFSDFFRSLEILIPTHIRRQPLDETLVLYTDTIKTICAARELDFRLVYENGDG